MKKFTKEELSRHNGENETSFFISYQGKIYDVSDSFLWKKRKHQVLHRAGFNRGNKTAPHGVELLDRFPVVGTIEE